MLHNHVNNMCKIGFYHVRNLATIRKSLDQKTANNAAATFTTSSLDYCNALLHGLPKHRIQLVQNAMVRVVTMHGGIKEMIISLKQGRNSTSYL